MHTLNAFRTLKDKPIIKSVYMASALLLQGGQCNKLVNSLENGCSSTLENPDVERLQEGN